MKKILLIGDSVRQGYDKYVKHAFRAVATVYYPNENCRFAEYVLRHLVDWQRDIGGGDDVDLVHWNAGLWDDLIMVDNKHLSPIEYYKYTVKRICEVIKILFPHAKMIFATSTPVREELFRGPCKRYNRDTEEYNAAAVEIVKAHGGEINDLYSLVLGAPDDYYSDMTHLYTQNGTRLVSDGVIRAIENSLGIKAEKLDYSALFSNPDLIEGV